MSNQVRPFVAGVVWSLFTLALAIYLIHRVTHLPEVAEPARETGRTDG